MLNLYYRSRATYSLKCKSRKPFLACTVICHVRWTFTKMYMCDVHFSTCQRKSHCFIHFPDFQQFLSAREVNVIFIASFREIVNKELKKSIARSLTDTRHVLHVVTATTASKDLKRYQYLELDGYDTLTSEYMVLHFANILSRA